MGLREYSSPFSVSHAVCIDGIGLKLSPMFVPWLGRPSNGSTSCLTPLQWLPAGTKARLAGARTGMSHNWNFSPEASDLLDQFQSHAVAISRAIAAAPSPRRSPILQFDQTSHPVSLGQNISPHRGGYVVSRNHSLEIELLNTLGALIVLGATYCLKRIHFVWEVLAVSSGRSSHPCGWSPGP